jgi:hypothetical protein
MQGFDELPYFTGERVVVQDFDMILESGTEHPEAVDARVHVLGVIVAPGDGRRGFGLPESTEQVLPLGRSVP